MKELVKVEINKNQELVISGRELHEKLEIGQHYRDWIKRMLEYGFIENVDYLVVAQKRASNELKGFTTVGQKCPIAIAQKRATAQGNEN